MFRRMLPAVIFLLCRFTAVCGSDTTLVKSDTLHRSRPDTSGTFRFINGAKLDSTASASPSDTGEFHMKKSPWLAVGLSAAVPGAGQIYDESYWKAPVIWGTAGYWVYEWISLNNKYRDYRDRYGVSVAANTPNSTYLTLRDFYHDERDKFAWFLGGLYLLNLVDAYVGAHLYDFDVGPGLTRAGFPGEPGMHATIRYTF
jgi:hypothetical protein